LTYDFEWAELPDDIAQAKHQAWQQWEQLDHQLHDPTHPLGSEEADGLERHQRAAWKQYWHADGARYHLSNRQMSGLTTHGASEGSCIPARADRLKELADAEWRKLLAKRHLEPPSLLGRLVAAASVADHRLLAALGGRGLGSEE
jgi:hypothetical protein